jgi:hypothetical protein
MLGKTMNQIKLQRKLLAGHKDELRLAIQLSRLINAIQANKRHYLRITNSSDSLTIRDQIELIIYHGAIIYEGLSTITKYCKELDKLNCWNTNDLLVKKIMFEANSKNSFTQKHLKNIRNKVMFHYDIEILNDSIIEKTLSCENVFAESESNFDAELAFTFADETLIRFIIDPITEFASYKEKWNFFQERLLSISDDLIELRLLCTTELVNAFSTIC